MNLDKINEAKSLEKLPSGRDQLSKLEQTGKFVFHGSPHALKSLEPQQAQTMDNKTSGMVNDGEPAVVTSQFMDVAIFRSIFNKTNIKDNYTSSFSYRDGGLSFATNIESTKQAEDCAGYVYVFNKEDFKPYSAMEYRSQNIVTPVDVVAVKYSDLPANVKIETE